MTDPDAPGAFLDRLVKQQWETAAKHAWAQYQKRGRGVIVFTLQDPGTEDRAPLRYMTFSADQGEIERSNMAMLYQLTQHYAPREEAVIAAVLPDGRTVFDVYRRTPTPSELGDAASQG